MSRSTVGFSLIIAALALAPPAAAQGTPIGFEETFALAEDREAALEQLIPGTPDYYFYHCLHLQQVGRFDEVGPLLDTWIERHGRTGRVVEIENRQALLRYSDAPEDTYRFLRERIGLHYDHQRNAPGEKPDLPTRLDPGFVSRQAFTQRALDRHPGSLDGFRDSAFPWLAARDLSDEHLMSLLQRLDRPDLPNLPALIVRNLGTRASHGFGSLDIHRELLLSQLEECVGLRPSLLNEDKFIEVYLTRLVPGDDVQWRTDTEAREAYLERLEAFAARLAPASNSLKAHVLYHRLAHDLKQGAPDKDRFMAYLRLPRPTNMTNPALLKKFKRREQVSLSAEYPTELGKVGSDDALVRAYLEHFFTREESFEPYLDYLRDEYVRPIFAETKILAGVGDMERWYSLLDNPSYYEALKERVEIEFAPTQPTYYRADEPVKITADVKNVSTLLLKVFEVNTFNYYSTEDSEVSPSLNLDGLVANYEETIQLDQNPLRRVRHELPLPSLGRRGVYVVELIGNGLSSRAVIRKGRLQYVAREGAAGHVFHVLDEDGELVPSASIQLGSREYTAAESGEIVVPYSTQPGRRSILLCDGDFTTLDRFDHSKERYRLRTAFHVERESLLANERAKVLVRARLEVNGNACALDLMEDPVLRIVSTTHDGVTSSVEVRDIELHEDRETVHEIQVPPNLANLKVGLRGYVQNLSQGERHRVADSDVEFLVDQVEETALTSVPLLSRTTEGYLLEVLGKNGEPIADRAVTLTFEHRDFRDTAQTSLKTDARGRIQLGALDGIERLEATGLPDGFQTWRLAENRRSLARRIQGAAGEVLRVPYTGERQRLSREVATLLERNGRHFVRDASGHLALEGGYVELRGLPAGDYSLWLPEMDSEVEVRVTAGPQRAGYVVGRDRMLASGERMPLHLTEARVDGDVLQLRVRGHGDTTRVHVFSSRYLPAYDPYFSLACGSLPYLEERSVEHPVSSYHSGREIGDEYRYILERRFARRFPGNMLPRPSLLLNPWALDETSSAIGIGGGAGGAFGGRMGGSKSGAGVGAGPSTGGSKGAPETFANLGFLPGPSAVLTNLRPDERGMLRVPLADLGAGQLVQVVVADDAHTVYESVPLRPKPLAPRDRRLEAALDESRHFVEEKSIEFVEAGEEAVIVGLSNAAAETYDSLASVFQLYRTLSDSEDLARFDFLLEWPQLEEERKRELYSEHACHELHFFLHEKDPAFFAGVIRPYLANKRDKTFLDRWLLGADLSRYLRPEAFERLNIVERILLTRRLEGEREAGSRHVRELYELYAQDSAQLEEVFRAALAGAALQPGGGGGVRDRMIAQDRARSLGRRARNEGPAGPATPGAPARRPAEDADDFFLDEEVVEEMEEDAAAAADSKNKLAEKKAFDKQQRKQSRELYRQLASTKAYVEHNYWRTRIEDQDADLIDVNGFWRDFADHAPGEPFFPETFAEPTGGFAEMMFALAVMDLPFASGEHQVDVVDGRLTLRASSPLLLVRRQLNDTAGAAEDAQLLISQNLFRLDDRYRYEGSRRFDKFVTGELLVGVAYGCQVVLTNPTSSPREFDLLMQIPSGAVPVQNGFETRGTIVQLQPYSTQSIEYAFYFPEAGNFEHYPAHVGQEGELVAFADARGLEVVTELSEVDTTSWEYVSQNGSAQQVLDYVDAANVQRIDLSQIAWRMRDRAFYDAVLARLRKRLAYDGLLWSYSLYHRDVAGAQEFLAQADGFLGHCGPVLASPLVSIDPIERLDYQHVEFTPLVNARAHSFGRQRVILNGSLAGQYRSLLDHLSYRPRLRDRDWISVTYYMLLQDRVAEAFDAFAKVDGDALETRVQYDYLRAYLDFYTDEHALARGIAESYSEHPVDHWREKFQEILDQLDEAEGGPVATGDQVDSIGRRDELAATESALDLSVEARRVDLAFENVEEVTVNYYEMDIELLFSTSPFVQGGSSAFAYVKPNRTDTLALPADRSALAFDLPSEFQSSNLLVEVVGGGLVRRQAYYANSLNVQTIESYGQLKVTHGDSRAPMPKVYVKVFARGHDGRVRFHKDGYTDLRGRFDYASVSGPTQGADKFALLVMSDTDGAIVREVEPPLQ